MNERRKARAAYSALCAQPSAVLLITCILFLITALGCWHYLSSGGTLILPDTVPPASDPAQGPIRLAAEHWKNGDAEAAAQSVEDALAAVDDESPYSQRERAALLHLRGNLRASAGDSEQAASDFAEAGALFSAVSGADSPEAVLSGGQLSLLKIHTGQTKTGEADLTALETLAEKGKNASDRIDALELLICCDAAAEDYEAAAGRCAMIHEICAKEDDTAGAQDALRRQSAYLTAAHQTAKAAALWQQAADDEKDDAVRAEYLLKYAETIAASDTEAAAGALKSAAALIPEAAHNADYQLACTAVYAETGNEGDALQCGSAALALAEGEEKAAAAYRIGTAFELIAKFPEASSAYEQAVKAAENNPALRAEAFHGMMRCAMPRWELEDSELYGKNALSALDELYGKRDHHAIPVLADLVIASIGNYDAEKAQFYADEMQKLADSLPESGASAERCTAALSAGRLKALLHHPDDAVPMLKEAVSLAEKAYGSDSMMSAKAKRWLADAQFDAGQYADAAESYGAAYQIYSTRINYNQITRKCEKRQQQAEAAQKRLTEHTQ